MTPPRTTTSETPRGSALEVLTAFTKLGVSAFGGPIAHIGYFRAEFVARRRWLDERAFADLVALCQLLPGPASSQVGFALGLMRAGPLGGLAAWLGFTAPSAILLIGFALTASTLHGPLFAGLTHGLKLVAVAIVAQAVMSLARTLTPDARRAAIAAFALLIALFSSAFAGQIAAIAFGSLAGYALLRQAEAAPPPAFPVPVSRRAGAIALVLFLALLAAAVFASGDTMAARAAAFYRSGALVFGGGHVVLPLLQQAVVAPHWVSQDAFLAGYGAAQAAPGPLFAFAAYLGVLMQGSAGSIAGGLVALVAIFLPGLLALVAVLPFWAELRRMPRAQAAMRGAACAVVGILAAALYDPVWTSAVRDVRDVAAVLIGFLLLVIVRAPPIVIVLLGAAYGLAGAA